MQDPTEVTRIGSDGIGGLSGATLCDRYRLEHLIGAGGMAQVWEATDLVLGRRVAVKLLHPHLVGDEAFVQRFRAEAIAAARLSHPGIVGIYDTCAEGPHEAIVMELLDAVTLRRHLDERKVLDADTTVRIGLRLLDALEAAHRAGLVHRDVKPSNILLSRSGEVKLADFGIATLVGGQRSIAGTPGYMSPEQREGGVVDARTDIYGLGVSLLEFAIGRRAKDVAAALEQVEDEDLRALLAWLVEPDLEKRASSAHQIGQEFERMVGRALAAGEEHPRDILAAYVSALAKMKVSAPVDEELGATASLAFGAHVPREPKRALAERFAADFEGSEATTREDEPSDLSSSSTMARAFSKRIGLRVLLSILALVTVAIAAFVVAFPNPRPPHPTGRLDVNVEPRAAIYVDGVFLGESPLHGLELPAGEHEIRVENHELGVVKVKRVRIPEGRTHVYEAELR